MRSPLAPLLALLVLAACASSDEPTAMAVPAPIAVEVPDTPVGRQLAWVLDVINERRTLSDEELREHFDDRLMAERNRVANVKRIFAQIGALAPLVPTELERRPGELVARAEGNGGVVRITISVERKTGRISGVNFLPGG
jgi:hypothetical protein